MSKQRRLAVVSPPRQADDPARQELKAAQEDSAKAKADLAADEAAEQRGRALIAELERELERATAAASDQQADAIAEALAAGAPLPASAAVQAVSTAVQAAISKQTEVKIAMEAARAGLARIRSNRDDRRAAIAAAEAGVFFKRAALTIPAIAQLVVRCERALADLARDAAVLRAITGPDDDRIAGGGFARPIRIPAELQQRVMNLLNYRSISLLQYDLSDEVRADVQRWRDALARLLVDADAPFPPPLPGDA